MKRKHWIMYWKTDAKTSLSFKMDKVDKGTGYNRDVVILSVSNTTAKTSDKI